MRKSMMMYKALPQRDEKDRLFVSRKGGGEERRGLFNTENSVEESIQRH